MVIAFEDKNVRALCEDHKRGVKAFGESAEKFYSRLADILAASSVNDLFFCEPFESDPTSLKKIIKIEGNAKIIVVANNTEIEKHDNGSINWSKVTRVKILKIEYQ